MTPPPRQSRYRNDKYPNLYRLPNQPCWIYRKYSAEKQREFYCSTGITANDRQAAAAYKIGVEKFMAWLGSALPTNEQTCMRDLYKIILAIKSEDPDISDATFRTVKNQIENHLGPASDHLKPKQITSDWWKAYVRRKKTEKRTLVLKDGTEKELPPITKMFNAHKTLMEALRLAKRNGLIAELPELELKDGEAAPPRYIPRETILRLIRLAGRISAHAHRGGWAKESRYHKVPLKLLIFIMWKQGARPDEVLQYRWDMIRWDEGNHGYIHIPLEIVKTRRARSIPLNPKVSRILRFLFARKESGWIFPSPRVPGERIKDYSSAWDTVTARLGVDFDIYNLRDTWITDRLKAGQSATFIGKYCDNSESIIRKRYAVAIQEIMEEVAK